MKASSAERRRASKITECKWRTSPLDPCCKAGVNYRELVGGENHGWMARLPCLPDSPLTKNPVSCTHYQPKTPAEIEAEEREIKESGEFLIKGVNACKKDGKDAGVVECPKCKGLLHYSKAKSNGHIWGRCETMNCLTWMM